MKTIIFSLILTINSLNAQNKFDHRLERNRFNIGLISEPKKNQVVIKSINRDEVFEGRYLGTFETVSGKRFYLIASSYVFDIKTLAKTENHIFVYNQKKQYVGYYYVGQMYELPKKLINNKLYFKIKGCSEQTIINLRHGIPKAINLRCNGENNYYEFQE